MTESSMYACALPIMLSDQIVWLVEHKHIHLTLPSTKLYIRTNNTTPRLSHLIFLLFSRMILSSYSPVILIHLIDNILNMYIYMYINAYTYTCKILSSYSPIVLIPLIDNLHIYTYIHICIYIYIFIYIYICIYIYLLIYIYVYIYICIYVNISSVKT
jgi:hypothetical protein